MKHARHNLRPVLGLVMALPLGVGFMIGLGCGESDKVEANGAHTEGGHTEEEAAEAAERHNFEVAATIGHVHAHRDSSLAFTVVDADSGSMMAGLKPTVHIIDHDGASREIKAEDIADAGEGKYTAKREFSSIGAYAALFCFEEHHAMYCNAFPVEVSKAGGEKIFKPDATNPTYSYQIRWSNDPGHIHAGQKDATFDVELMRSFGSVNTEKPWTNSFDHLTQSQVSNLVVKIEDHDGNLVKDVSSSVSYKGKGIYRVTWAAADQPALTENTHYALHVSFTDPDNYTIDETGEDYEFGVAAPH